MFSVNSQVEQLRRASQWLKRWLRDGVRLRRQWRRNAGMEGRLTVLHTMAGSPESDGDGPPS